ncbi:diguanylate cyclase [Vibrio sp. CK2-1]|uniref:sensor domain-containing diguanylate cyclase n=1 Tax=Vibrio sp. CK2-1 TaxID=2912249 RepID=UPI001F01F79C|nr:diguanylate cyclase [Vibrio sp. CK2-1]MCF7355641.1 diguanylate cyclase [Vibrio sp. CK2-1]
MPQLDTTFAHLEEDELKNKRVQTNILKRFSLIWTAFTLLCLALGAYWYHTYTQNLERKLLAQEEAFVATTKNALQKEMKVQLTVLHMVSKAKVITDYIDHPTVQDSINVVGLFSNLTQAFQYYDQIRLFDLQGNELVRVDYDDGISTQTDISQLQNKNLRYYFQESLSLKPGEIYISRMDLNIENGEIEVPYKPTLRFATQVLDKNGEAIAVVILNYMANDLLENFRHQSKLRINGQGMIIDGQGYWLSNHDRSNEWGHSLGEPEKDFEQRYPLAWPTISANDSGLLKTRKGLFRYQNIEPLDFSAIETPELNTLTEQNFPVSENSIANTNWKLVIFLPNETIHENSLFYNPVWQLILCLLYLVSSVLIFLLISHSEQKKFRRTTHRRISAELHDLYENAPCGYHSLDANGTVTRINQTELNWLGYDKEEVIGQSFDRFLTPASQKTFQAFLELLPNEQEISGIILEVETKQGETFFVSTSAVSIFNEGNFAVARTSAFDITDRIELEKRLEYIAHTDVLTGISNRRHFFERVTPIFKRHLATQEPLSLLMIDIDHFKQVNDGYGHDIGDMVLQQMSLTIQQHIGGSDIFARLGGEEFAVVTTDTQEEALKLAENIRKVVSEQPIEISGGETLNVTLSIGIVAITPDISNIDNMLKQADIALYQAKTSGRNRVVAS